MGFNLSWTEFSRVVRRDINNYVAFAIDGSLAKARGAYQYDVNKIRGKATNQVAIDAAQKFFLDDTPVEDSVRGCADLRKFVDYRKVRKGWVIADDQGGVYGTIARWVICHDGVHLDAMKADGTRTQIVAHGARLLPELPTELPADLDYSHYVDLALALIHDITDPPVRTNHLVPIGELSERQRRQQQQNAVTMTPDPKAIAALDLDRATELYAAVCRGNYRDSMKHVLLRLWWAGEGVLSHGDLLHCAKEIDAAIGYFAGNSKARNLEKMVEWIACDISAFPKPRSTRECADQALGWAMEHVEPAKRRRKMKHHAGIIGSTYLSNDSLRHFARTRNEYKLACHIAAGMVKHDDYPDAAFIAEIIGDVRNFVELQPALAEPQSARDRLRMQQRWDYFSSDYGDSND